MELVSSSNSVMMIMMIIFSVFAMLFFQLSNSATVVVDGVSQWQNPTVQIGDSIIFKHKYGYKLYIFQNRRAFNTCNFTQATLLTNPKSNSYTWHPTRLGFFYFSFNNASTKACQNGQKLAITVSLSPPPESFSDTPEQTPAAAPLPSTGGIVSSSPAYPWPFQPRESSTPSPAPIGPILPATSPSATPEKGGGIPFINSNPAVPLPTGEVDSAIIRPSPTSDDHRIQVVGLPTVQRFLCFVVFMMLL
ncbi:hypothetical protein LguiB_017648 [Lonicera macranthoides]